MPRPSRSNLTSPIAAQSSLSHCRTERFSIRPHSTGQTWATGRSQITIPPEWIPRCRGKSWIWLGQFQDVDRNGMFDAAAAAGRILDLRGQR